MVQRRKLKSLPALIACIGILPGIFPKVNPTESLSLLRSHLEVTQRPSEGPTDPGLELKRPINCEDFQAHLDHAIIKWQNLKGTHLVIIARLGTGERDRALNLARLHYIEGYLRSHDVLYVLGEGSRTKGFGRIEVYVGGKLLLTVPIKRAAKAVCSGSTG